MVDRKKKATLHPEDERRIASVDAAARERMVSVEESMNRISAFAAEVDSGEFAPDGIVLEPMRNEDSLVIHIETVVRSIA